MPYVLAFAPRTHAWPLTAALLCGCNLSVYHGSDTETSGASSSTSGGPTGGPTGDTTTGSIATSTDDPTDGALTGSTTTTTTLGTTSGATGESTTGGSTTTGDTSTGGSTTGAIDLGKMEKWGHPCETDEDCMTIVGDKGVCLHDVLGLYELPGGYCTKGCALPDLMTMYVPDHPSCGPGVTCIGAMGYFEACALECTDNSECPLEGYECRTLPVIGMPGDPMFCLMTEAHKL